MQAFQRCCDVTAPSKASCESGWKRLCTFAKHDKLQHGDRAGYLPGEKIRFFFLWTFSCWTAL